MEENKADMEEHVQPVGQEDSVTEELPLQDAGETFEAHEDLDEEAETFENEPAEKLLESLKAAIRDDRIAGFRKSFALLRNRYKEIFEEEKNHVFNAYLEEGGKPENFKFTPKDALGELKAHIQIYSDRQNDLRKREDQQLQANLLAKQDVIDEMKKLITEETDIRKAFEKFQELKNRWSGIGAVPAKFNNDLWNTYKHFTDAFYDFVKINKELYEMDLRKNLETKQQLIRRVEGLMKVSSITKSIELLHNIQKEWRETGPVPKHKSQEIFQKFKESVDKIYERRNEFIEERDVQRKENLEKKTALCIKAEEVAGQEFTRLTEWKETEVKFKALEDEWKTVGRVPAEFNDSIWERFKAARKDFYKKKYALLKHISSEYEANYQAKAKICEQAEALVENTDWKETSNKLIKLQKDWKKIGPVDRKRSDEIWNRFRAACDAFFGKKEQHFFSQEEKETENLEAKKAVIELVKAFVPVEELDANLQSIRDLQKQWGEIGFVPIKEKSTLEKAFSTAIDEAFAKLNIDRDKKNRIEYKVRIEGWLQQPNAIQLLRDERTFVGNKIRKMEEEILQIENNLGFFKLSKGANDMMKQFEDKVKSLRDDLTTWEDKKHLIRNALKVLEGK